MTTRTEETPSGAVASRSEGFKEEVRSLKIKDPNAGRDALLLRVGVLAMVVGVVVAVVSYFVSHNTTNSLEQNDALTIGLIGIALTIAGAALFLRYSFAGFMRFWLARFIYEQRHHD
jgi:TRAP-type C4-dicarboxylate transport system permease small subunit